MSEQNKQKVEQVDEFLSQLPTRSLIQNETRLDQVALWMVTNQHCKKLGQCLKTRFDGTRGNPLRQQLTERKIDEIDCEILWAIVDYYQAMFDMIQLGWPHLEDVLSHLSNDCPHSEVSLFFEILRTHYNNQLRSLQKSNKFPISEGERALKLERNAIWANTTNSNWTGEIDTETANQITNWSGQIEGNYWLSVTLRTCNTAAQSDNPLRNKLREVYRRLVRVDDLFLTALRKRNSSTWNKMKSIKSVDGSLFMGTRGGYKPLIEIVEELFTKLDQT